MKRKNLGILLVTILTLAVSGCDDDSSGSPDSGVDAAPDADQRTDTGPDANDADPEDATPDADEPFVCDPPAETGSIHELEAEGITDFRTVSMCEYRGQVVLFVNIAALCGFTPQLGQLADLQTQFQDRDFTILGFYSDQFGRQAGSEEERQSCQVNYGVNFPVFQIVNVNPPDQHPIFAWLLEQSGEGNIEWNFEKFLVGRDGSFLDRWRTQVTPDNAALVAAIEEAL